MVSWAEVEETALRLPRARRGEAPDGAPTVDAGRHPFARHREVDGRALLQFWCRGEGDVAAYRADPERFTRVESFAVKTSVWVWLDRLATDELREVLTESWRTRTGRRT